VGPLPAPVEGEAEPVPELRPVLHGVERRREGVERALGVGGREPHGNVEVKYTGPDGVMLDVSETGWVGTDSFGA
jgi:hypothetical protein